MPSSCTNDTNCIALNLAGGKLQASLTIDPDPTNGAVCRANGLYVASPITDWLTETVAWAYVSASSFTEPGDLTSRYIVGRRISFLDAGTQKYAYVISSSYAGGTNLTTVNVIVSTTAGAASTLSGGALTMPKYALIDNPYGFPSVFAYTPAYTGWAATPNPLTCNFSINGRSVTIWVVVAGTSNAGGATKTINLPIAASAIFPAMLDMTIRTNEAGGVATGFVRLSASSVTLSFYRDIIATAWTASGTTRVDLFASYPI